MQVKQETSRADIMDSLNSLNLPSSPLHEGGMKFFKNGCYGVDREFLLEMGWSQE